MVLLTVCVCTPVVGSVSELEALIIKKSDGDEISYRVEIADSDVLRRRGLMYREHLPGDQGMLLDFRREARVGIWMKNTYIPLDLLFIDGAGMIIHVHPDAVPHSTQTIRGGNRVRAVLEINAGQLEAQGIQVGDRVIFPSFGTGE